MLPVFAFVLQLLGFFVFTEQVLVQFVKPVGREKEKQTFTFLVRVTHTSYTV